MVVFAYLVRIDGASRWPADDAGLLDCCVISPDPMACFVLLDLSQMADCKNGAIRSLSAKSTEVHRIRNHPIVSGIVAALFVLFFVLHLGQGRIPDLPAVCWLHPQLCCTRESAVFKNRRIEQFFCNDVVGVERRQIDYFHFVDISLSIMKDRSTHIIRGSEWAFSGSSYLKWE